MTIKMAGSFTEFFVYYYEKQVEQWWWIAMNMGDMYFYKETSFLLALNASEPFSYFVTLRRNTLCDIINSLICTNYTWSKRDGAQVLQNYFWSHLTICELLPFLGIHRPLTYNILIYGKSSIKIAHFVPIH